VLYDEMIRLREELEEAKKQAEHNLLKQKEAKKENIEKKMAVTTATLVGISATGGQALFAG
jgi:hypothetical protein